MIQQLLTFITVAQHRNFTRAAEHLHTTQPAVSQQIQTLERTLGAQLFERTNRSVELNQAGRVVYDYAKQIIDLYNHMTRVVDDMIHDESGVLRIGASFTFGEYILPQLLAGFVARYPRITPSVSINNTRDVVDHVGLGLLDIGIVEGHYVNDKVSVEHLADDMVFVIGSSRWLNRVSADDRTRDRLEEQTWILREEGSGTREVQEHALAVMGIAPSSILEIGSTQSIKECVEAGLGLTILSEAVLRKEVHLGTLQILDWPGLPLRREFSIVMQKTSFHPQSTHLFKRFLQASDPVSSLSQK
ncbi:LysR family transcriptional regulator [Alicyclobacillus dauci]|uniref:LysR family transcriptional regulator n=1 Tax=Alicyclobacillus dauci TaxID=1475485 RepID=A0ABY6Z4Q6_9BACL|nr:LysR family transcriptional regulator [Alicyclobacillus dauci]WAH37831.1 LysR family transcriptional regulator [Alicyclobacillus dauci]